MARFWTYFQDITDSTSLTKCMWEIRQKGVKGDSKDFGLTVERIELIANEVGKAV